MIPIKYKITLLAWTRDEIMTSSPFIFFYYY